MRYFDTSALVPYYRPEPLSDQVQQLLLQAENDPVCISFLTETEFASVMGRLVRMGELSSKDAAMIQAAFQEDIHRGCYRILDLHRGHYQLARDWLLMHKTALRTLDSLHLAVTALSDLELVTADSVMAKAAELFSIPILRL
ncbi:MAG: type II toxin-antitoxin system VapC family toxin [Methylothermaceae bacterium]|nr:type II toxin-antitoxin system VapC family toxin [Methylothermaceae bacterium]